MKTFYLKGFLTSCAGSLVLAALTSCGPKSDSVALNSPSSFAPLLTGDNVMLVTVGDGDICGHTVNGGDTYLYPNEPCGTVTICEPGTTTCQTISDVLIDTGSNGLRLFASAVKLNLAPVISPPTSGNLPLAECAQFGTGTTWGPIVKAQVGLAAEPGVTTPIQLINNSYQTPPSACARSDATPKSAGYNGILGIGLFKQDCGNYCATRSNNSVYYACSGGSCISTRVPLEDQLQNPVSLFPVDNNGLSVQMPMVSLTGATKVVGSIVFGIGTQANNTASNTTFYQTDSSGNFSTTINGTTYTKSFTDTGSNGLFFPSSIPTCSGSSGFYCPSSVTSLTAVNSGYNSGNQVQINFSLLSASALFGTGNYAFTSLGGSIALGGFDWGLPFFFGRKVFVGIENTQSSLGAGPYWAF